MSCDEFRLYMLPRPGLEPSDRGKPGPTKSGRARTVQLSRRLRSALLELYRSKFGPGFEAHVLPAWDPSTFRRGMWRRLCKAAGLGHRNIKDLRDSFASHLLTAGVNPALISEQLGHSTWAVTAQHYAKWIRGRSRKPLVVDVDGGELEVDLLARLPKSARTFEGSRPVTRPVAQVREITVGPPGFEPGRVRL